jgi:hypothetical protein
MSKAPVSTRAFATQPKLYFFQNGNNGHLFLQEMMPHVEDKNKCKLLYLHTLISLLAVFAIIIKAANSKNG